MRRAPCGYCATHALPYLCTPTGVSCLSSELFSSLSACRKEFFDTLKKLFKLFNRFWYKSAYTKNGIRRKVRHRLILKSDQSMGEALTVAAMVQTADGLFLKHRLCLAYPWA